MAKDLLKKDKDKIKNLFEKEFKNFNKPGKEKAIYKLLDLMHSTTTQMPTFLYDNWKSIWSYIKYDVTEDHITKILDIMHRNENYILEKFYTNWHTVWTTIKDKVTEKHITQILDTVKLRNNRFRSFKHFQALQSGWTTIIENMNEKRQNPLTHFYSTLRFLLTDIDPWLKKNPGLFTKEHAKAIMQAVELDDEDMLEHFYDNWNSVMELVQPWLDKDPSVLTDEQVEDIICDMGFDQRIILDQVYKNFDDIVKVIKPRLKKNTEILSRTLVNLILNIPQTSMSSETHKLFYSKWDSVYAFLKDKIGPKQVKELFDVLKWEHETAHDEFYKNLPKIYKSLKNQIDAKIITQILSPAHNDSKTSRDAFYDNFETTYNTIKEKITDKDIEYILSPIINRNDGTASDFYKNWKKIYKVIKDKIKDKHVKYILDITGNPNVTVRRDFYRNFQMLFESLGPRMQKLMTRRNARDILGTINLNANQNKNQGLMTWFYNEFDTVYKAIKPTLEKQPGLVTISHANNICDTMANSSDPLPGNVFRNFDSIHDMLKNFYTDYKDGEGMLLHQAKAGFNKYSGWNQHGKVKEVVERMIKENLGTYHTEPDYPKFMQLNFPTPKRMLNIINNLEEIEKEYKRTFKDGTDFGPHVIAEVDGDYKLEDKKDVKKIKTILKSAFADVKSLGKLFKYYNNKDVDSKKLIRENQDFIRNLNKYWIGDGLKECEHSPNKTLVEGLIFGYANQVIDKRELQQKIFVKLNQTKGIIDKLRLLNAVNPYVSAPKGSDGYIDRRYLNKLVESPFNIDDLEVAHLASTLKLFDLEKGLEKKREKEGEVYTWFVEQAKGKIAEIVGHRGKVHDDFKHFTLHTGAVKALFEYGEYFKKENYFVDFSNIMKKFLDNGNKGLINNKFSQTDVSSQVGKYAATLKKMYSEPLKTKSRSKIKDLYNVFAVNISQIETHLDKTALFKSDAKKDLEEFLKDNGLEDKFNEIVKMQVKDIGSALKEWKKATRLAGKIIPKKAALEVAQKVKSVNKALEVVEELKKMKGLNLKEQERFLTGIKFDKKVLDDLSFISGSLDKKPAKIGLNALKDAYAAIDKYKPSRINITARIGDKLGDFLTMGYHGNSCYRPKGGYEQSILAMLNDAHEHLIVFEQNKNAIGRASLHGAWLGKEFVFVLEKPYTERSEIAPQMVVAAEKLCRKIHKRTGIRTLQPMDSGKRFEVRTPFSFYYPWLDYATGGSAHVGVTGRIIEHTVKK